MVTGASEGRQAGWGNRTGQPTAVFFFNSKDARDHIKCIISFESTVSTTQSTTKTNLRTNIRRRSRRSFPSRAAGQSSSPTSARFNKSGPVQGGPCPLPIIALLVASLLVACHVWLLLPLSSYPPS